MYPEEDEKGLAIAYQLLFLPCPPQPVKKRVYWSERVKQATNSATEICFDAHLLRAMEPELSQVTEGRQLALKRVYAQEVTAALESAGFHALRQEATLTFDTARYPFREALLSTLRIDCALEGLHELFNSDGGKKKHRREKMALMLPLTDGKQRAGFENIYNRFVCEVIAPHMHAHMKCDSVVFQCFPCVRVHRPGEFSIGMY
jgi:hypothetical protein